MESEPTQKHDREDKALADYLRYVADHALDYDSLTKHGVKANDGSTQHLAALHQSKHSHPLGARLAEDNIFDIVTSSTDQIIEAVDNGDMKKAADEARLLRGLKIIFPHKFNEIY